MNYITIVNGRYEIIEGKAVVYRWQLPTVLPDNKEYREIQRINRFLGFMERRLTKVIREDPIKGYKKFEKFTGRSRSWAM